MNTDPIQTSTPPILPPAYPLPRQSLPLGQDPADTSPIGFGTGILEAILRHPRRVLYHLKTQRAGRLVAGLLALVLVCGALYGIVVGTFSGGTQLWAAPLKIAGGLLLAGAICLPSLYIFACLSGSQARFLEIAGFVAGVLALTTVLLIGFAPVAWLFAQSTESIVWMGFLHVVFWLLATLFGLRLLSAGFRHSEARSTAGLAAWMIVFLLVSLQMTTALRPIVGTSEDLLPKEKKFFLAHWGDCIEQATRSK